MTQELLKSLLLRFLRGALAGAVANMVIIATFSGTSWNDVGVWLSALALSGAVGAVGGIILTADKYFRSEH